MRDLPKRLAELPELIDDRAIATTDEDELRHAGFAEELAELVRSVAAPANVALFGSWGAGKSGLGKLLCHQLDGKDGTRCVIYDAFKYSDFPLRRDFISQVASGLEIDKPEFHDQLYSAGSEYLDKVFQYQLPVPPLMGRRLSGFALRLLESRGGIWNEVDHDRVVSALIPAHVRSPRRVKTLLNAYVITYRMARRRWEERVLYTPANERAEEIAKLVCLRHEFPLFAAELVTDAQMPQYVLQIAEILTGEIAEDWKAERPNQVREDVWERAGAYAMGTVDVDIMLADELDEEDREALRAARHRHGSQLLAYLHGTARIAGPARDLIHLETGGEAFGLSPAFADDLEDEAVAGASASVVDRIIALEDRSQRGSALRLLARRASEAETSGERRNALVAMAAAAVTIVDAPDANGEQGHGGNGQG
jgi:KAP family P-loop domain